MKKASNEDVDRHFVYGYPKTVFFSANIWTTFVEKAMFFNKMLQGDATLRQAAAAFAILNSRTVSGSWKSRVRNYRLKIPAANLCIQKFKSITQIYDADFIYNVDETGLNRKALLNKPLVARHLNQSFVIQFYHV